MGRLRKALETGAKVGLSLAAAGKLTACAPPPTPTIQIVGVDPESMTVVTCTDPKEDKTLTCKEKTSAAPSVRTEDVEMDDGTVIEVVRLTVDAGRDALVEVIAEPFGLEEGDGQFVAVGLQDRAHGQNLSTHLFVAECDRVRAGENAPQACAEAEELDVEDWFADSHGWISAGLPDGASVFDLTHDPGSEVVLRVHVGFRGDRTELGSEEVEADDDDATDSPDDDDAANDDDASPDDDDASPDDDDASPDDDDTTPETENCLGELTEGSSGAYPSYGMHIDADGNPTLVDYREDGPSGSVSVDLAPGESLIVNAQGAGEPDDDEIISDLMFNGNGACAAWNISGTVEGYDTHPHDEGFIANAWMQFNNGLLERLGPLEDGTNPINTTATGLPAEVVVISEQNSPEL
ncbi:hypothetical protein HOG48_01990 [Candidatus Peregrinibacteria bacterium]|nr:hypothetical protein [Candidatus Peregrinibacteria bacterium]